MENQPVVLRNQDGKRASCAVPAFPILVKEPLGSGRADQSTLLSNHNSFGLVSSAISSVNSKVKTCLPVDCTSGGITVTLDNNTMWNEFYHRNTEMILTKQGRRMFPYCRYWITGLESNLKYILVMDISPVDNYRYKWNGHSWEPSGKAEPHVLGRVFIHPESPSTGHYWMHQPVSFYKLKLTNNALDQEGHIILHSMHRYLPRLHLVPADKATEVIQLNGPDVCTFTFPQTEFFAVTAYQNIQITQLKIDYNPFAKGFLKDGLRSSSQCEAKQNGRLEYEVFPNNDRCPCSPEADILDPGQRGLNGLYNNQKMCNTDLERESFNSDINEPDEPELKQETSEFPIANPCESDSHMKSLLISSGDINVSIKEELVDDSDYVSNVNMERMQLKQEDINKETEDFSCSDDDPILEKQLKKHSEMGESHKRSHNSPLGVAKTKMLKLDNRTMSAASIEAYEVTKSMVKISALQSILSSCRTDKSLLKHSEHLFPAGFENIASPIKAVGTKIKNFFSGNNEEQKYCLVKDVPWENIQIHNSHSIKQKPLNLKCTNSAAAINNVGGKKPNTAKKPVLSTDVNSNPSAVLSGPCRRGRPQKLKSEVEQPLKYIRKAIMKNRCAPLRSCSDHPEFILDHEDVDGVLFVSFESKEDLNNHTIDQSGRTGEPLNEQTVLQITCDSEKPNLLEIKLLEDLKSFRHKQVIHPSLQEVGLKLGSVDPAVSIDLKYLGVQLPLRSSKDRVFGNNQGIRPSSLDASLSFISRTGKTDDFRKIKGWQEKVHNTSRHEGTILEGSLKNRSAFCSDTLDEYLENEGKLMQTSMGFPPNFSSCPVVHQFSSESSNYVQAQHSILKKKCTPPTSYNFKPLSLPSFRKRRRNINRKKVSSRGSIKSSNSAVASLALSKEQYHIQVLEDRVTNPQPNSETDNTVNVLMTPDLDEDVQGKQGTVCWSTWNSNICTTDTKLMDLEGCALQDGKPQTYITEERADFSLRTLFISQFPGQKSATSSRIQHSASPVEQNVTEKVEFGTIHLEEKKSHKQETETVELQITMSDSKPEELLITQPQSHVEGIMYDRDAVTSWVAGKNTEMVKQLSSAVSVFQLETVLLDHSYFIKGTAELLQNIKLSEDTSDDIFQIDNSESNEGNKNVDIRSVEKEFLKKTNNLDIETAAAHALPSRQLNLVHDHSDKVITPSPKQSEFRNSKLKEVARVVTRHRSKHTEEERCRRKEIKELFEKLQVTLQLHGHRVAKRILLEKAFEEIQGLVNQADKLMGQKKLLMRRQDILIHKASALSGKTQEVVLKKLQYISTKQKAVEAQQQQQKKQPVKAVESAETARPYVQDGSCSEMKKVIPSQSQEKSIILCTTDSHATENEDSFLMPRIVNVMSLATEEDTDLNLDINRNPYVSPVIGSLSSKPSLPVVSQEINFQCVEKADSSCGKEGEATDTTKHFTWKKEISFSQMGNDSSLKESPESFATKLCVEELAQRQAKEKQIGSGESRRQSKDSSFQELQVKEPKAVGVEMELQKVAFAIQEAAPDASDMNDNTDETLTSLLNEIVFLNHQLNDGASDVSEVPNSLSSCFSPGGMESPREPAIADGAPFQFGSLGGNFTNLCLVQESSGSITPLLLYLEDDSIADYDRTLGQPSSKPGVLKLMLGSEVKDQNLDLSAVNIGGNGKHLEPLSNTTHVSPPILKMKTSLEPGKRDTIWKPMPKLAPFGLKSANFPLDSGGQITKVISLLEPINAKVSSFGLETTQSVINQE
ncbi:PREDICTED: MAX gene-associated protein-like [Gekko japonicus]|uniref:MAX gene-associated protein-like n=1 Tax=Gekko japonicus TaxID=146911 RepID=A0ABM1LGA8_GEKJA|nr:PREDICTED: MAX gene-associated protein-like [Gekko japonicus]